MKTLILENEYLKIVSLLDKGSDIIELRYKPSDLDFIWHSPTGYRNPASFKESMATSHSSFMDLYGGGWQDILPIAGHGPTVHRGGEWGLHGETPLMSWECNLLDRGVDEASAYLWVDGIRYPYRVERWFTLKKGEAKFWVKEKLTNTSKQELEFCWLQHPAYGEPFISPGAKIYTSVKGIYVESPDLAPYGRLAEGKSSWPYAKGRGGEEVDLSIIPERDIVAEETVFLTGFDEGWYAITNSDLDLTLALRWDAKIFSWLWFWQNYNLPDYPWYGEAWNIALEPCTSYPGRLPDQIRTGTALRLKGRSSIETELLVTVEKGVREVRRVASDGSLE